MSVLETQWWQMQLPPEWQADQEDEMIIVSDEDGVGEITLTTLEKEAGEVRAEEINDLAADIIQQFGAGQAVSINDWTGLYFEYREDGDAVREWYLYQGKLLLLITYSCDDDNAGMDDGAVDEILATLLIHDESAVRRDH